MRCACLVGLLYALAGPDVRCVWAGDAGPPRRVTYSFDQGLKGWAPLDIGVWAVRDEDGRRVLHLVEAGPQRPPVRRPGSYTLAAGPTWTDVTISARVRSLAPASRVGRDVVLLFGFRDDTHFYYAHLSNDANATTHNVIMIVDGTERRVIQHEPRPDPRLSDGWHDVRVSHRGNGEIKVWMDDMDTPLMTASDTTYPAGRVGVGSFDDTALFDDIVVEGRPVAAEGVPE